MNKIKCAKGCCILNFTNEIHHFKNKNISKNSHRESAGIAIIVDENIDKKILITQSYNNLWGIPKGKRKVMKLYWNAHLEKLLKNLE